MNHNELLKVAKSNSLEKEPSLLAKGGLLSLMILCFVSAMFI